MRRLTRDLKRIRRSRLHSIAVAFVIFSISGHAQLIDGAKALAQLPVESEAKLYTRTFKIGPSTLVTPTTQLSGMTDPQDALRKLLITAGIDLTDPARVKAFYNERTEILMVRASEPDLKLIEDALATLKGPPPLVRIEVRMVECPQNLDSIQKLTWIKSTNGGPLQPVQTEPQVAISILTEPQATSIFKELEKEGGVDIMTPPAITTMSGRQARISVEDQEPVLIPPFYAPRKPRNSEINP
jgi:type II secretory pathway component GspD/PulD (secretin)